MTFQRPLTPATDIPAAHLFAALEGSPDAIVISDGRDRIAYCNGAAERLWSVARADVVGTDVGSLIPPEGRRARDARIASPAAGAPGPGDAVCREMAITRTDGTVVHVHVSQTCPRLPDGSHRTIFFLRDVTAEMAARTRLRFLSLVADETDTSVVIADAEGRIVYVNPGFERLTGFAAGEAIGQKPGHLLQGPQTDPQVVARVARLLRAGQEVNEDILNYTKGGQPYWIGLAIAPVRDTRGEVAHFISVQANITDIRRQTRRFDAKLLAISDATAIAEWSVDGDPVECNPYLTSRGGSSPPLVDLVDRSEMAAILGGTAIRKEIRWPTSGRSDLWIDAVFSVTRDLNMAVDMVIMCGSDATPRHRTTAQSREAMNGMLSRITGLVGAIGHVTRQAHMLSVNASIEAARAGDAGRGFSVIATEIRNLAGQVADASIQIDGLITEGHDTVARLGLSMDPGGDDGSD